MCCACSDRVTPCSPFYQDHLQARAAEYAKTILAIHKLKAVKQTLITLDNGLHNAGTSGSHAPTSMGRILAAITLIFEWLGVDWREAAVFCDVGAGVGVALLAALGIGFRTAFGIEMGYGFDFQLRVALAALGKAKLVDKAAVCEVLWATKIGEPKDGAASYEAVSGGVFGGGFSFQVDACVSKAVFAFDAVFVERDKAALRTFVLGDPSIRVFVTSVRGNRPSEYVSVCTAMAGAFQLITTLHGDMKGSGHGFLMLVFARI